MLPYCSDLGPLVRAVARVLDDGGLFAFTAETHDGSGVLLRETMRYAHGEDHVRAALTAAGLAGRQPGGGFVAPGEERPGAGAGGGGGETGLDGAVFGDYF